MGLSSNGVRGNLFKFSFSLCRKSKQQFLLQCSSIPASRYGETLSPTFSNGVSKSDTVDPCIVRVRSDKSARNSSTNTIPKVTSLDSPCPIGKSHPCLFYTALTDITRRRMTDAVGSVGSISSPFIKTTFVGISPSSYSRKAIVLWGGHVRFQRTIFYI